MKNRVLSWLLVAAMLLSCLPAFGMPVHAEEPATEGEDLFSNATCGVGVKQTEVTNGSNEAWKLTPGTDWTYPGFALDREYDISNHILVMDVMPVETSMDRLHICGTTGASWVSAEIYDTLPAGQWTTVTYDLSANSAGATSMSDITFGMRIYSMEETGGLYIDNVRLIEKDTKDLFYGASSTSMSRQHDVTNGSGEAWKFVPNAADWRYFGITLNGSHDITNHKLVVDVMPVDITVARFHITGVSGQSYPSNDTLIESLTPGVWQTIEFDLSIAVADEITSIDFGARFDSITGENPALYFDNARLVEPDADLLGSAAVSGGTIQYNVTNNSNASFKITASAAGEWRYFDFTLPAGYDVSDHNLVFDLIPVDLTMSRFHITGVSGQSYPSNDTIIDTFKPDAWQTVALDLSVATAKEMTSVSFGLRVDSITGKNPAIYIDNVRVVKHDQDDLLYGASAADAQGFFSGGNYSYNKYSAVVNGENSTQSWCFTAAAGANDTPAALIGLGKSVNMTGKYLALDVLFDNANGYIGIVLLADSNWAVVTADGWNVKSDLPTGEWTTVYFDIAGMLAEGKTLDDICFVKFVFAVTENTDTVRNIYVDNLRLVDEMPVEPEPEPTEPPTTEPPVTEPPVTEPPVTEPPVTEPPVTEPTPSTPEDLEAAGDWLYDKGFSDIVGEFGHDYYSYDTKSTEYVKGANSLYSFKVAYDGTNFGSDDFTWPRFAVSFPNAEGSVLDLAGKKLVIDVYVAGDISFTPVLNLVGVNDLNWQTIVNEQPGYQLAANQWTTIEIDFSTMTEVEGKSLTAVHFLFFQTAFHDDQAMAIYLDNAQLIDMEAEKAEEASDLLYNANFLDIIPEFNHDHFSTDPKSKDFVKGEDSLYSFKVAYDGTDLGAADTWPRFGINFGVNALDVTGKKLVVDVYLDGNVTFGPVLNLLSVHRQDQANIANSGASYSLTANQWTTIEIDFTTLTVNENMSLADFNFLWFQTGFKNTEAMAIYFDNARLVDVEPEEECEHDWGYGVTTQKPTLDAEGERTYTCSKCGETKTEAIDKLVGNGSTVDEWSLTLKGDINVNFDMALDPAIAADPNAYVLFTVDGKEYKFTAAEAANQLTIPVAAAQMKDQIQVTVYDGNGTAGTTFTYSVHQYADYILRNSEDENLKALVKNMLNYGAKAQEYFDHNANDLANEDVSVDEVEPNESYNTPAVITGQFEGFEYYGASLVLREKVYIRFYFTAENGVADLTFFYGNEPLTVYKAGANLYFVETAGINPHEYSSNAVITVQQDGNDTTYSVGYSVMNYIARNYYRNDTEDSLKATLKAMYGYHLAAVAYIPTT